MSQIDNNKDGSRGRSSQSSRSTGSRKTGTGRGQSNTPRSSYQPRRSANRKRHPQYDITKILLGIIVAVIAVIAIVAVLRFTGKNGGKEIDATTTAETQLQKEVTVDGILITGMSREQAKTAILKEYEWGMKVTYQDKEYEVGNLMETKVDTLLDEIFTKEPRDKYTLDTSGLEESVKAEAKAIAAKWDVPAKNGSISSYDAQAGAFVYAGEQNGIVLDQEKLAAAILEKANAKEFKAVIDADSYAKEVAPEITEAQAKEMYQVIGTYTTTTTTNSARNKNIELASGAMNGMILQPGEEFSFNKTTGERSEARGYRPAGAYLNGELVEEPGGGVCQVSSTLYNAVVFAGLTTTERHAHSYEPSYVTPGEDAMVSFGGPDMRFVNNSSSAIAIRTSFSDRKLRISIVGIPILEEGVTLSMTSTKTGELDAPAPVYEEDQTMQLNEEKVVKAEKKGSRWVTNLVTKKNGTVVSDEFFHNSSYRGKPATIKRNTSGVVVSPTTEAVPSESVTTSLPGESMTQSSPEGPGGSTNQPTQPTNQPQGPGETTPAPQPTSAPQPTTGAASEPAAPPETEGTPGIIPPNPFS